MMQTISGIPQALTATEVSHQMDYEHHPASIAYVQHVEQGVQAVASLILRLNRILEIVIPEGKWKVAVEAIEAEDREAQKAASNENAQLKQEVERLKQTVGGIPNMIRATLLETLGGLKPPTAPNPAHADLHIPVDTGDGEPLDMGE